MNNNPFVWAHRGASGSAPENTIVAFKRAIELTDAMSCRCYTGGEGRTRLRQMKFSWRDVVGSVVTVAVCAGVIVLNYFFVHLI